MEREGKERLDEEVYDMQCYVIQANDPAEASLGSSR